MIKNILLGTLIVISIIGCSDKEKEENWNQYKNQDLLTVDYIDYPILIYLLSSKIYD